jgi:fructose-1-phosphate kinase PfkB-like protein
LVTGLSEQPCLIQANHHELGELYGMKIEMPGEAIAYRRKALEQGAQNVIVLLDGRGAFFVNRKEAFTAQIPQRKPKNLIRTGVSMVVSLLYAHTQEMNKRHLRLPKWLEKGDMLCRVRFASSIC